MAVPAKHLPLPDLVPIRRALLSVSDKHGLADLARALAGLGVELVSTGGTARTLAGAGLAVRDVSDLTGFPEIMDGRVKTLHPMVHGGLLGIRDDAGHSAAMDEHGIGAIDLLVVNLYPFEDVSRSSADDATVIENIDVGGPAMLRGAAKNHAYVTVITDPSDYPALLAQLEANRGAVALRFRQELAAKAYALTASYDAAIASWFGGRLGVDAPSRISLSGTRAGELRYGENPHQKAGFFVTGDRRPGVATAQQAQGKQLSYNNIADTDAAYELVAEFDPSSEAAVAIIKHANPCGVALSASLVEAYRRALACDPVSAFGGIVALNRPLDAEVAEAVARIFTEVIIAPSATEEARAILAAKPNLRLLLAGALPDATGGGLTVKSVAGGLLVQDRDGGDVDAAAFRVVTRRAPEAREMDDLRFAFRVAKHVKSNAIVFARDKATVGIGAGQMSRIDSTRIAVRKAGDAADAAGLAAPSTQGSVLASDAFFPFADGIVAAAEAGATAIIQPGGSLRDADIIETADRLGLAMVFTGMRHFRH